VDPAGPTPRLIELVKAGMPGAVLETSRFGRGEEAVAWVEVKKLAKLARFLRDDPQLSLDWLENLSVAQLDDALVLTYFLRSTASREQLILRASLVPRDPRAAVEAPSVADAWPPAALMEQEAEELFGVRFTDRAPDRLRARRLPEGWSGFPLRKGFVFPREVDGIPHARPGAAGPGATPPAEEIQP
jgi:NADH:ubiquinone oxidoreductase subunit C